MPVTEAGTGDAAAAPTPKSTAANGVAAVSTGPVAEAAAIVTAAPATAATAASARSADAEFVRAKPEWAGPIADFDKRIFGRDAWPRTVWEHELRQPDRQYLALVQTDPIRSLPQINAIAGMRYASDAELVTVSVAPNWRRQGIARRLVTQLLAQARAYGSEQVFLEVRAHSAGAIKLYASLGFEPIYRRRKYYSDDDALVMRLRLAADAASSA